MPLLKYLGPQAVALGADVATDAISGENVLDSLKSRGKTTARSIASDAGDRAKRFAQTGKGKKRTKRLQSSKRSAKKITKRTRSVKKKPSVFF